LCPTQQTHDCPSTHNGAGVSETCEWWVRESASPQWISVNHISGTPYTPGSSYRIYMETKLFDPSPSGMALTNIWGESSEGPVQISPGSVIEEPKYRITALGVFKTFNDHYYKLVITQPGQDVEVKVRPNSDADFDLYLSTIQGLYPFAEPAGTRYYVLYSNRVGNGLEESVIFHNPQPGYYYILVNHHPHEPKSEYGYTLEVKRVSQTSTTTSTIGQSGGGGGGRMPYMMDLINIIREFISKIFKI